MKRLLIISVGMALAVFSVAFSPGPELGLAVTIVLTATALCVLAVPWMKSTFSLTTSVDLLTGHDHTHSRADGLGAGGRQGPPRGIVVLVMMAWALIMSTWRQIGHAGKHLLSSAAGNIMARTNTAAQTSPS